jgi:hypothetical protein
MLDAAEFAPDGDLDAKFLAQLPLQCLFPGFPGLQLATRELPEAREVSSRGTLRDQESPAVKDQSRSDIEGAHVELQAHPTPVVSARCSCR